MGFRIFATGLRGFRRKSGNARKPFHYVKSNCLDQGDFDPPAILSMIPDSPDAAGVVTKIVGTAESHIGAVKAKGIFKIAELVFAHHIVQGINFLALHGRDGNVSVYCHQKRWYWADANSFANCYFYGSNPGREFLRKIGPGLKHTELNNFGVLAQIAIVLSKYDRKLPKSAQANLRIEIRH